MVFNAKHRNRHRQTDLFYTSPDMNYCPVTDRKTDIQKVMHRNRIICRGGLTKYRILPIKGASPNKGAPHSLGEAKSIINVQNTHSFLNNCPILNPKPLLESSEPQLPRHNIRCDLAKAPGALIRQNTVYNSEMFLKHLFFVFLICF